MIFTKLFSPILTLVLLSTSSILFAQRIEKRLDQTWDFKIAHKPIEKVKLPHTWNAIDAADGGAHSNASADATSYLRGRGTYTTMLDIQKDEAKRYFLNFEGSAIVSDVTINNQNLGNHKGAFGAFTFEVTDLLKKGENKIEVIADNTFNIDIPPTSGDFSIFGGLYRHVNLIETQKNCISPLFNGTNGVLFTQTKLNKNEGILTVNVCLDLKEKKADRLAIKLLNAKGEIVAQENAPATERVQLALLVKNPIRWNGLENPYLYTVFVGTSKGDDCGVFTFDNVCFDKGQRTLKAVGKKGEITVNDISSINVK